MQFLENRKIAVVVLVVCVLVSIFGMGGGSLARARGEVMRVFNEGTDTSLPARYSMDAYLENAAAYARTMAEELRLQVSKDNATAARALELAGMIGDGKDLDARYKAYDELKGVVESMYTDMYADTALTEANRKVFKDAYNNFNAEVSKIKFDAYHQLASDFNRSLSGFPAGIIGSIVGAGELNPF